MGSRTVDYAYRLITKHGPMTSNEIYGVMIEDEQMSRGVNTTNSLTNLLIRSPLFRRIGYRQQHSARGIVNVAGYTANTKDACRTIYVLWDINDLDEVALSIISKTHRRSIKRLPLILQRRINELEASE